VTRAPISFSIWWGGEYINRNLACLAMDGRLVQIAFLQGAKAEINLAQVMMKRQTITGSTLRPPLGRPEGRDRPSAEEPSPAPVRGGAR